MKRRQFTQTLALVTGSGALAAGAGLSATVSVLRELAAVPPQLSRTFFDAQLGDEFCLCDETGHTLVLTSVEDASRHAPGSQFHVVFEAGSRMAIGEGTYRLEHSRNGLIDLFLTRSDGLGGGPRFTTTFNLATAV